MADNDSTSGANTTPSSRWWWLRALGVLSAIAVGLAGILEAQPERSNSTLLIGLGAAAVLLTVSAGLPRAIAFAAAPEPSGRPRRVHLLAAGGSLLAIALWAASLYLFPRQDNGSTAAWLLYLLSMVVAAASFFPWKGSRPGPFGAWSRPEWIGLFVVVLVAAAPRLHLIGSFPYGVWFDEAQNGLEAIKILEDPAYRPVFVGGVSQMPALIFYYYALFITLLGPNVLALRIAMTVAGLLSVVAVWLLGRELFGPRVAAIAAALLAVCRWHIGFSRFATATMLPSLLIPLTLFLFVRSQDRLSPRAAVLCGLCMGLAIQTYYAILAAPVLLLLLFIHRVLAGKWRSLAAGGLLALTFAAAALAYGPVYQYARRHPEQFTQRFSTVSILKVQSASELLDLFRDDQRRTAFLDTLKSNTVKHLRMFHLVGDPNGRHNLPGEPMLDPVTGLFLAIGAAWCLLLVYRSEMGLLAAWFVAMIAAGILSLDFEAPQGARSSGLPAVIALIAAIPLERASRAVVPRRGRLSEIAGGGLALGLLAAALVLNWWTYFHRQRWDGSAWAAYSTPETKIAEVVKAEGEGADVYVPPAFVGGPTETFVVGHPITPLPLSGASELPLVNAGRNAIVFLLGSERAAAARLNEFYPEASVEAFGPPLRDGGVGEPVMWIARVSAEQMNAIGQWQIRYLGAGAEPIVQSTGTSVWNWGEAPLHPPFRAEIRGFVRFEQAGDSDLFLQGTGEGEVAIDGEPVLRTGEGRETRLSLAAGNHRVSIDLDVRGPGSTSMLWRQPGSREAEPLDRRQMFSPDLPIGGLLASYYRGLGWQGTPALQRVDPQVAFYFHLLPLPRPFSVHWTGRVYAPSSGSYAFSVTSIDDSSVTVAGQPVAASIERKPSAPAPIELERGWHPIEVRYENNRSDYAQVYLYWTPPGGARELVPGLLLQPPGPMRKAIVDDEAPRAATTYEAKRAAAGPPDESTVVITGAPALAPAERADSRIVASIETGAEKALRLIAGPDDRLYVLDAERKSLLIVQAKKVVRRIDLAAVAGGAPGDPSDLALDPSGAVLLLDGAGKIAVFSPEGEPLRVLDLTPLRVYNPRGLAASSSGELLVADTGGGRLLALDQQGALLRQLGRRGTARGELADPISVAFDDSGEVVVVDAGNSRIQTWSPQGEPIRVWAHPGIVPSPLSPQLAADGRGRLWLGGGGGASVYRLPGSEREPLASYPLPAGSQAMDLAFTPGEWKTMWVLVRPGGRVLELQVEE